MGPTKTAFARRGFLRIRIAFSKVTGTGVFSLLFFFSLTLLAVRAWSPGDRAYRAQTGSDRQSHSQTVEEIDAMAVRLEPDKIQVRNETSLVRLIRIDKVENRDLVLTLQNGYDKSINGFQVSVGNVGIHTEYMYNPDQMIPPGGNWILQVPIEPYTDTKGITFMSVHFEDGTGDGNEAAIKMIEEERAGQKTQIRRALALIRRTLSAPNADSVASLNELLSQLRSLPSERVSGRPDFSGGLDSGKKRMIGIIEALRERHDQSTFRAQGFQRPQSVNSISTELMTVVEKHERVVSVERH